VLRVKDEEEEARFWSRYVTTRRAWALAGYFCLRISSSVIICVILRGAEFVGTISKLSKCYRGGRGVGFLFGKVAENVSATDHNLIANNRGHSFSKMQ